MLFWLMSHSLTLARHPTQNNEFPPQMLPDSEFLQHFMLKIPASTVSCVSKTKRIFLVIIDPGPLRQSSRFIFNGGNDNQSLQVAGNYFLNEICMRKLCRLSGENSITFKTRKHIRSWITNRMEICFVDEQCYIVKNLWSITGNSLLMI